MKEKHDRTIVCRMRIDRGYANAVGTCGVEAFVYACRVPSEKSTTTIDDQIVTEIRTKLEADGKL